MAPASICPSVGGLLLGAAAAAAASSLRTRGICNPMARATAVFEVNCLCCCPVAAAWKAADGKYVHGFLLPLPLLSRCCAFQPVVDNLPPASNYGSIQTHLYMPGGSETTEEEE